MSKVASILSKYEPDEVSPLTISQKGFVYVWVSNESKNAKVWFDDLKVTHVQGIVTQATDYYPYGSVARELKTPEDAVYRFGYQGQFAEKDVETGWNHFELREFDPVVGRWTAIDPKAQYFSPYIGMGNNPISRIDLDGGYSRLGAWVRSGFSNNIYESGGEWGYTDAMEGEAGIISHFGDERSMLHQLDPSTVGNWFFTFGGPNNPKNYDGTYNYDLHPQNISDKMAYFHDKYYDEKNAVGGLDLFLNTSVINADISFVRNQLQIAGAYASQFRPVLGGGIIYVPVNDPITNTPLTLKTGGNALLQGLGLGIISTPKIFVHKAFTNGPRDLFPSH